jgi:hypothetical protein
MPEPVKPQPDPIITPARPPASPNGSVPPMPYPGPATRPPSSSDGAVPTVPAEVPMPSEVTNERGHTHGSAAAGRFRTAMMPLRKMMHLPPRGA